ncbi:MAG: gamma-glutamyl-gamma-aminobutyrate hydrolase family protein [Candidatus Micrarchaeota archaeon]|nr:gamma-glutamyl-gamma-aminobutyrate hydrolase family protein [Candidatus Micrarchaeota archaeon]
MKSTSNGTDDNGTFAGVMEIMREVTIPQLTICATHQLLAIVHGGTAGPAGQPEYGMGEVFVEDEDEILKGLRPKFTALLTHNDEVKKMPKDFVKFAHSEHCKVQAMKHKKYPLYGVQFHPETVHTQGSALIFENFKRICRK